MSPPGQKVPCRLLGKNRGQLLIAPERMEPLGQSRYCIGIWKVRFMNQGKWDMIKQEVARVNIDILGVSELKRIGMGEFNSDEHYIYYCGQESLRRVIS